MQAQKALSAVGLGVTVDGYFGDNTLKAILELIKKCGYDVKLPPEGQITENFNLKELIHSNTAVARGIKNNPSAQHELNLVESVTHLWQPVRDMLGTPMIISSGYRSPTLNKAVGGSSSSAHSYGYAIDFKSPAFGDSIAIAKFLEKELKARKIPFDQMILEFPHTAGSWVHLGYKNGKGQQRGKINTAKKVNGRTVYLDGLHY